MHTSRETQRKNEIRPIEVKTQPKTLAFFLKLLSIAQVSIDWIARPVDTSKRDTSLLLLKVVMCKLNRICSGRCSFRFFAWTKREYPPYGLCFFTHTKHTLTFQVFFYREREKIAA